MRNNKERGRGMAPAGDNMATVQEIRQQIKAIKEAISIIELNQLEAVKEAISIIELKLSQLETVLRAQPSEESQQQLELPITARSAVTRVREENPPERPSFKLKTRRSNK